MRERVYEVFQEGFNLQYFKDEGKTIDGAFGFRVIIDKLSSDGLLEESADTGYVLKSVDQTDMLLSLLSRNSVTPICLMEVLGDLGVV